MLCYHGQEDTMMKSLDSTQGLPFHGLMSGEHGCGTIPPDMSDIESCG